MFKNVHLSGRIPYLLVSPLATSSYSVVRKLFSSRLKHFTESFFDSRPKASLRKSVGCLSSVELDRRFVFRYVVVAPIHGGGLEISLGDEFLGPVHAIDRHMRETFIVSESFPGDGVGQLSCGFIFLDDERLLR